MTYLFNENPVVIDRELASVIGLNEAIILQQIQYWIKKSEHKFDGKVWVYNSVSQWKKQFPFWSESTIDRTIRSLDKLGLLFIGNYNRDRRDRTKWYSINYSQLDSIMKNAFSQNDECNLSNCDNAISQNDPMQDVNLTKPLPKTTTKITTKITTNIIADKPQKKKRACQIPYDFDPVTVKPKNVSLEVWKNWIDYRSKIGKKLQPQSWTKQARMLEEQNNPDEIINQSIMNGWQGLFPTQKKAEAITNISASNTPSTQDETSWIDDIERDFF